MLGSYKDDWWERLRLWAIPKLGLGVQLLEDVTGDEYYVTSETHNKQFVGRVNMGEEEFEKRLDEMGFERNPLASLKTLASTGEKEEGSWRKVGYDDYPNKQLHVVLYDGDKIDTSPSNCVYVYAHWEYRWDTHPMKHYRGVDSSGSAGVRRMKNILDARGIVYKGIRP